MKMIMRHLIGCILLVSLGAYVKSIGVVDDITSQWNNFKTLYNKTYPPDIESERKAIFKKNLVDINFNNMMNKGYDQGINAFSDMEPSEVIKMLCKTAIPDGDSTQERVSFATKRQSAADNFDWRDLGVVSPVKDQKQCGACWAFAAVQAVECLYAIQQNSTPPVLSPQELVDCSVLYSNMGCGGGYPDKAYKYMQKSGIQTEDCYSYTGMPGICRRNSSCSKYDISGFKAVTPTNNEEALMQAVETIGPISVAIYVPNNMGSYKTGVYSDKSCENNPKANHAVLVTGHGVDADGTRFWIIKNSWGADWGEAGYLRLKFGSNMCCIACSPTYPTL